MKRTFPMALGCLLLVLTLSSGALGGEVIDAIVATVNRQPLFQSDWEEATSFEAFMQQKPLASVTQADRVKALQRLIDRQLLLAQMGTETFLQPSEEDLVSDVAKLRAQLPNVVEGQQWLRLLAGYGLTPDSLKEHLRSEVRVMNFVEVRLRPNIRVQPEEVESYYQNQLLPDLQKTGGAVITLNQAEPKIRELLVQRRMDELLDVWLHNLRQQAEIKTSVPIPAGNAPADENGAPGSK